MACTARLCTAEKMFIFINIAFAMYSGALLSTAARLAWDPSTYAWFRFLCAAQYRVSAAYVAATGLWLAALVYLAAAAAGGGGGGARRRPASCLHAYCAGVLCLALSELCYAAWMGASLAAWWRDSPQAELARRGIDLLHDVKPALRAMQRHQDVVAPLLDMIEEVEHEAPNNVFVIIVFGVVGMILQVAAFVMARRLLRRGGGGGGGGSLQALSLAEKAEKGGAGVVAGAGGIACADADDESALTEGGAGSGDHPPGWRKKANLRMYTILDKIF